MAAPKVEVTKNLINKAIEKKLNDEALAFIKEMSTGKLQPHEISIRLASKPGEFQNRVIALFNQQHAQHIKQGLHPEHKKALLAQAKARDIQAEIQLAFAAQNAGSMVEAFQWLKKAADNNTKNDTNHIQTRALACFRLAVKFIQTEGTPFDPVQFAYYYVTAFQLGYKNIDNDICLRLAECFLRDQIKTIPKELVEQWKTISQQEKFDKNKKDFIYAALAHYHASNNNAAKNSQLAKQYFILGAKNNNFFRMLDLAQFYFTEAGLIISEPAEIFACCEKLATEHNFYAAFGVCHLRGYGVKPDPEKALELLEKPCSYQWHFTRFYQIDCQLDEVFKKPISIQKLLSELEKMAEKDEVGYSAKKTLCFYYFRDKNIERLTHWSKKLFDVGSGYGYYYLGKCYDSLNIDVAQNKNKAFECYQLAAEKDEPDACYEIGLRHRLGSHGVKKDAEQAFTFFNRAKNWGCIEAIAELGDCYCFGRGTAKNIDKALECYTTAAKKKEPHALFSLGFFYQTNIDGRGQDLAKATKYFEEAHALGYPLATLKLVHLSIYGIGCEVDHNKAFRLLRSLQNVNLGTLQARFNLYFGLCLEMGWGTAVDLDGAFKAYDSAAEQHVEARFLRARFWDEGKGSIATDKHKASVEYQIALDDMKDFQEYSTRTTFVYSKEDFLSIKSDIFYELGCNLLEKGQAHHPQAFECFNSAQQLGHIFAPAMLSLCHREGIGTAINPQTADFLEMSLSLNGKSDPWKDYAQWQRQQEENEVSYSKLLIVPNTFAAAIDIPESLFFLQELIFQLNTQVMDYRTHTEFALKWTNDFETAKNLQGSSNLFAKKAEKIQAEFLAKYKFFMDQAARIYRSRNKSITRFLTMLQNDLDLYKALLVKISSNKTKLLAIRDQMAESFINFQKEKERLTKKKNDKAATKPEANQNENAAAEEALAKKQKDDQEKRAKEKEAWKKITAQFQEDFLAQQKRRHDNDVPNDLSRKINFLTAAGKRRYPQPQVPNSISVPEWRAGKIANIGLQNSKTPMLFSSAASTATAVSTAIATSAASNASSSAASVTNSASSATALVSSATDVKSLPISQPPANVKAKKSKRPNRRRK